jgi:hypothetical protein
LLKHYVELKTVKNEKIWKSNLSVSDELQLVTSL